MGFRFWVFASPGPPLGFLPGPLPPPPPPTPPHFGVLPYIHARWRVFSFHCRKGFLTFSGLFPLLPLDQGYSTSITLLRKRSDNYILQAL